MQKAYRDTWGLVAIVAGFFLVPGGVGADVLKLKNGRQIEGRLDHYFDEAFTITEKDGKRRRVSRSQVSSIELGKRQNISAPKKKAAKPKEVSPEPTNFLDSISKPDSPYSTPPATFSTWREAAIKGDLKAMVRCYASYRQKDVRKQLKKLSRKKREEMRSATAQTDFFPSEPFFKGERAMLEITWSKGLHGETQVLQFVLEGNDWKILQ